MRRQNEQTRRQAQIRRLAELLTAADADAARELGRRLLAMPRPRRPAGIVIHYNRVTGQAEITSK